MHKGERMNTVISVEKNFEHAISDMFTKNIMISVFYVLMALGMIAIINRVSRKYRNMINPKDVRLRGYLYNGFGVMKLIVVQICAFAILQANGINISSIITGTALIAAIAGLALQDFFKDIIMGLHLLNDHSVIIGENVEINGIEGTVLSFTLVTTILEDLNSGNIVHMNNRNITQVSKVKGVYSVDVLFSFDEKPENVRAVLAEAAKEIGEIDDIDSADYVGLTSFTESGAMYRVRFACSPKIHWPMLRVSLSIVQKHIQASNLVIPYQQLDVHQH
jgi:small-conductance mechanosensitive channel